MTKKRRGKRYDYSKHEITWSHTKIGENCEEYYGLHRDGARVKIDIKRMKKVKDSGVPEDVLDAASQIPRNTMYFQPKRIHRHDYVVNQFRDKIAELQAQWQEFKCAFEKIDSPADVADRVRVGRLMDGVMEYDEACEAAMMAGFKRQGVYRQLWLSQCSQFILQMATELDALLLRKCRYLGFAEKKVTRGALHTYLHGTQKGRVRMDDLVGFKNVYSKFFDVYNFLKHNSEDLFEKVRAEYPDMLLTDTYHNGEMAFQCLKIGDAYIEQMLKDLLPFYEALCREFFDEDPDMATWNYDDYFIEIVRDTINAIENPFDL